MSIEIPNGLGATPQGARRRDTILAGLEAFRSIDRGVTVSNILAFLYVAENEGISVSELAAVADMNIPGASRSVRALAARGARWALPPYLGLIEVCARERAGNSKTLRLTAEGAAFRRRLDTLIKATVPIRLEPEPVEVFPSGRIVDGYMAREPVLRVSGHG